ncbi:dihydrolipoamide acetyltransferase family protein [Niallia oryzisoli]|uniref:dihydrolipoamide acetyltransferase family protein n=1 Tax=Niallia oryzisoli TaxID=1737571 RepID=UPI003736DB65
MAHGIFMPKLSSTMETGTILQWFKEEGESVEIGEPIFEIMTDKINIEVEAYEEGVLLKRYFDVDAVVPVNTIIGYIGEEGENVPDESPGIQSDEDDAEAVTSAQASEAEVEEVVAVAAAAETRAASNEKLRATPAAKRIARENQVEISLVAGTGPEGRIQERDVIDFIKNAPKATPLARKLAQSEQVDLASVTGTGVNGKILKQDIAGALAPAPVAEVKPAQRKKLAGMRKVIADRMITSVTTAPHVTLTSDFDMTKVKEIRAQLLPTIEKQTGYRLSFTEIIIKATSLALSRFPSVNAALIGDEIIYNEQVNIGLAVAVPDGLMVPVLRDTNLKGLAAITAEAKEIGKKARDMKLSPAEMQGSTFTISNLGMYAIDGFTPIINQPETAILGIGRIQDKPVVVNGAIEVRPMMVASLSFDHRVIDGAPAAEFLTELKRILENPYELLV